MVTSRITRALLGLASPTLFLLGCFDVREVDTSGTELDWPRLRVVDDFEADWPTWNLLAPWRCDAWGGGPAECDWTEGSNGNGRARYLSFDLLGEGESDYANAQLTTIRRAITLDLSAFEDLVFDLKLDPPVAEPLPDDFLVRVSLNCPAAAVEGILPDGELVGIHSAVAPPADGLWHPYALNLDFTRKSWQPTRDLDAALCLTLVDSLSFEVAVDHPHVHFAGTIAIDDVALEDFEGKAQAVLEGSRYSPWYFWASTSAEWTYTLERHVPTPSLALGGDASGLCTSPVRVDDNHEFVADTRSLAAFKSLSLSARVVTARPNNTPTPFNVTVGCDGFHKYGSVSHSIEVFPEWSSYRLDLEDFDSLYRKDFSDVEGCLAHLQSLCVETDFAQGETFSGTLEVDNWVLR